MKFVRAVLREYTGVFVDDPAEPVIALRAKNDSDQISLFHQFVKLNGAISHTPEKVHAMASPCYVQNAIDCFADTYTDKLEPIGETYCVAPYTMGFARLGTIDKMFHDNMAELISSKNYFFEYTRRWLETPEGYETVLEYIAEEEKISVDDIRDIIKNDTTGEAEENMRIEKNRYLLWHAHHTTSNPKYPDFVAQRVKEFKEAAHPLMNDEVAARIEHYFNLSVHEVRERNLRDKNIKDYIKSMPLLQGWRDFG